MPVALWGFRAGLHLGTVEEGMVHADDPTRKERFSPGPRHRACGPAGPRRPDTEVLMTAAAEPRTGWVTVTVIVPAAPDSARTQTAPTPPASPKAKRLSPMRQAGPITVTSTCPPA